MTAEEQLKEETRKLHVAICGVGCHGGCDKKAETSAAMRRVANAAVQGRWIPVEERLPETRDNVLVLTQHGASIGWRDFCDIPNWTLLYDPHTAKQKSLEAHLLASSVITHWQPLPAPPAIRKGTPE